MWFRERSGHGTPADTGGFHGDVPDGGCLPRGNLRASLAGGVSLPALRLCAGLVFAGPRAVSVRELWLPGVGDRRDGLPQDADRPAQVDAGDLDAGIDEEAAVGSRAVATARLPTAASSSMPASRSPASTCAGRSASCGRPSLRSPTPGSHSSRTETARGPANTRPAHNRSAGNETPPASDARRLPLGKHPPSGTSP